MRMAGPDIVLFVVGALLFGGATYAIVNDGGLGGGTSALGVFEVAFSTTDVDGGSSAVADFRSAEATFDVTQRNVASVVVSIQCADNAAGVAVPFMLQVQVAGPNGAAGEGSGRCGEAIDIDVPVAQAPTATTVSARTEDEAREALGTMPGADAAVGEWTVVVSGGRQGAPVAAPAGNPSGSIDLTLKAWEPRFTPVQR